MNTTGQVDQRVAEYGGKIGSLQTIVSYMFTAFLQRPGCYQTSGYPYGSEGHANGPFSFGIVCDERTVVRRLNIFSGDQGDVHIKGPGYWDIDDARVDWTKVAWGIGGGVLKSDSTHGGSYAANVIVNTDEWYELTLPLWAGRDVTIDFSDPPGVGIPAVTLKLKINGLPCILNSSDAEARRFVYPYGLDHTYSLSEGDYDGRFCAEVLDALEFPEQVKLLTVFSSTPPHV